MENNPLKKKNINNRKKPKLKGKKKQNIKQKKFNAKIIFKIFILFVLILSDINFYSLDTISPKGVDEAKAFQEILSFENNLNLTDDTFYEFLEINEQNKLIENNIKFEKVKKPIVSVVMLIYNQAHCLRKCLRSIQNQV